MVVLRSRDLGGADLRARAQTWKERGLPSSMWFLKEVGEGCRKPDALPSDAGEK